MELRKSHPLLFWLSLSSGLLYMVLGLMDVYAAYNPVQTFFGFASVSLGGPILISTLKFGELHRKLLVVSTFYSSLIGSLIIFSWLPFFVDNNVNATEFKLGILWLGFSFLQYYLSVEPPVNPANWDYNLRIARKTEQEGGRDE